MRTRRIASVLTLVTLFVSGCSRVASPVEPTRDGLSVDPALAAAYGLLLSNAATADWTNGTVAAWASADRPHLHHILVGSLPVGVRAQYDHVDTITVSPDLLDQRVEVMAAFIAHEIRHADGVRHDCADGVRDAGGRGAWFVHLSVLRSYGLAREADIIRDTKFCG